MEEQSGVCGPPAGGADICQVPGQIPWYTATRLGLWVADLSVQQIFQERVDASVRGEQQLGKKQLEKLSSCRVSLWRAVRPPVSHGPPQVWFGGGPARASHVWSTRHPLIPGRPGSSPPPCPVCWVWWTAVPGVHVDQAVRADCLSVWEGGQGEGLSGL